MISLRAPKIFTFCPSQAEFSCLFGLLRSSRSTFSPSLTAQIVRTEPVATGTQSRQHRIKNVVLIGRLTKLFQLRSRLFLSCPSLEVCASQSFAVVSLTPSRLIELPLPVKISVPSEE